MICSRMLAGVDQSILRSTRNPLLNHEDSRCATSRSSAARSLWPFIEPSRSARIATRSLVPPGARFSRRISSCRRGSEAKCRSLASSSLGCARQVSIACGQPFPVRAEVAGQRLEEGEPLGLRRDGDSDRAPRAPSRCRRLRRGPTAAPRRIRSGRRHPALRRMTRRGAAACGRARKSWRAGRRKRRCAHGGRIESRSGGILHGI